MLAPSVHEDHLFTAMVLAFVLWARNPSMSWPAIGIALFANLNLVVFYGLAGVVPFSPGPRFALLTGALSAVATGAFCYPHDEWNTDPVSVDRAHERLWDVADSQILRCWRHGLSPQNFAFFDRAAWRRAD